MIYFVQGELTKLVKIGKAVNCEHRLKNLQCGSPDKLNIIKQIHIIGTAADYEAENLLHKSFKFCRRHGEWFEPVNQFMDFVAALSDEIDVAGIMQLLYKYGLADKKKDLDKKDFQKMQEEILAPGPHGLQSGNTVSDGYTGASWREEKRLKREIQAFRKDLESRGIKTAPEKSVRK